MVQKIQCSADKNSSQLNVVFYRRTVQKFCMLGIFRSLKIRIILSSPSSWQLLLPSHPKNTTKGCAASPSCFCLVHCGKDQLQWGEFFLLLLFFKRAEGEGRLLTLTITCNIIFDLYMRLPGRQRGSVGLNPGITMCT